MWRMRLAIVLIAAAPLVAAAQEKEAKTEKAKESKAGEHEAVTADTSEAVTAATAKGPLDFRMTNIDGERVALSQYGGEVVLIVNVASKCGLTPQYEQLQGLHEKYAGEGLRILAFPANDFGKQEPGTNKRIKAFCTSKFGVEFDLFAKVSVKGDECCELYKFLTSAEKNGKFGKPIAWNFTKFLVDRSGKVVGRFEPRVKPDSAEVVKAIEKALKEKKPA